jgi:hypothetical protein
MKLSVQQQHWQQHWQSPAAASLTVSSIGSQQQQPEAVVVSSSNSIIE